MVKNTTADPADVTPLNIAHPPRMAVDPVMAGLSTTSINAPRPNFPLPRELRDQIYGYLLDSSCTRVPRRYGQVHSQHNFKRDRTGPKAYHFHTSILAVDRAIHDEAEELIYKSNTFVVVSYQWPSLGKERGDLLCTPIMSNKHVARMSLHSLRIHVNPGMLEQGETNVSVTVESYIILAGDLNCFCATIHARERGPNGTAITITTAPNMVPAVNVVGLQSDGKVSEPAGMRCQLRNTRYRSISRVSQSYMLAPLAAIIGKSQMVTFTGPVCYYQQIAYLKKRMGPSLVCQNAVQWHSFEQCEVVKEVTDAAVKHDELELVVQLYRIIAGILSIKFANPAGLGDRLFLMQFPNFAQMLMAIDTFHRRGLAQPRLR